MVDIRTSPDAAALKGSHLDRSYVDAASVVGGAIVATAIFTALSVFGSAVGLSLTSADLGSGISAKAAAIAVGIWTAWIAVSSFVAGGYIAGRLRHRIADASPYEVEMRDGLHGLISWGLAAIFSGMILASALGGLNAHSGSAATMTQNYEVSKLFRGERTVDEGAHADAKAVLASALANKSFAGDDRTYLAQLVSAKTGAPAAEAGVRADAALNGLKTAADQTRRGAVLAAFLAAVALALGAAAAWWAGTEGGKHRDQGTLFSPFTKWG